LLLQSHQSRSVVKMAWRCVPGLCCHDMADDSVYLVTRDVIWILLAGVAWRHQAAGGRRGACHRSWLIWRVRDERCMHVEVLYRDFYQRTCVPVSDWTRVIDRHLILLSLNAGFGPPRTTPWLRWKCPLLNLLYLK